MVRYNGHLVIPCNFIVTHSAFPLNSYTAYQSSPAHIEIIVEEKSEEIVKEKEVVQVKLSKKQLAQTRNKSIKVGGGI